MFSCPISRRQTQNGTSVFKTVYCPHVNWASPVRSKASTVVAPHNIGLLYDPQKYRPVNHKPILARLAQKWLTGFLTTNDIIGESLHGFLSTDPVSHANYFIWKLLADKKKDITTAFLAMIKEIGRLSHERPLLKVESYGLADQL